MTVGGLLLSLDACTSIPINDHEFCGSLGANGASCWYLLTNENEQMSLQQFAVWWDDLKDPKVATSVSTLMDWKGDIEQMCTITSDCTKGQLAQVSALGSKMNTAIVKAKAKK